MQGTETAGTRPSPRVRAAVFSPLDGASRSAAVTRRLTDAIALGMLPDDAQPAQRGRAWPNGSASRRSPCARR
nr:hypothetical protein [Angustibacter aerolatus]